MKSEIIKQGFDALGHQRYLNTTTKKVFRKEPLLCKRYDKPTKDKAISLYLEGLGYRAIGRILGVSQVSIMRWIKKYALAVQPIIPPETVDVVELDEMWHFLKKS